MLKHIHQDDENDKKSDEKTAQDEAPQDEAAQGDAAKGEAKKVDAGHDDHADEGSHDDASHDEAGHEGASDDHGLAQPVDLENMTMTEKLTHGMKTQLDTGHLFEHVHDSSVVHLPFGQHFYIPNPLGYTKEAPMVKVGDTPIFIGRPTKFMAWELIGAIFLVLLFVGLARRIKGGKPTKNRFYSALEAFVVFIRDEIARPAIGKADTNRFLPFLLTLFFFILVLNLIGMIPGFGAATGSLSVTAVFAVATFLVVIISGMQKMGVAGFLKAQVPSMDLPGPLAVVLIPAIWFIEIFGLFVKHFVLAVRLFANMFAGHLVLAVMIGFVGVTFHTMLFYAVGPMAVIGAVLFSLLEIFVAFLQAYVFTFLAALFIGSAQHAH